MSKVYEEDIYIVTVRREKDKEFGEHITEVWNKQSSGEEFRPYDQPSTLKYDPKTKEELFLAWTLDGIDGVARKGGNPCVINRGSFKPSRIYGTHEEGDRRVEFPSFAEYDEKTRRLTREIYDEDSFVMNTSSHRKPDSFEP